jgi:hypothetical protein
VTRLLMTLVMLAGLALSAEARDTDNPFRVEAEVLKLDPKAAGALRITIAVPKDHHIYKDMVEVAVLESGGLKLGDPSLPPGLKKPDPADPSTTREVYDMDVIIEVPVGAGTAPGTYPVALLVTYQGCKKSLCWMPQSDEIKTQIQVR